MCHAPVGVPCSDQGDDHFARVVKAEAVAVGNVGDVQ
ncbi:hypothetical protein ACOADB_00660 [Nocardioides sp. CPCC 206348]